MVPIQSHFVPNDILFHSVPNGLKRQYMFDGFDFELKSCAEVTGYLKIIETADIVNEGLRSTSHTKNTMEDATCTIDCE